MHALFVDDEVEFLQLMEKRLSRRGMTILTGRARWISSRRP